MKFSRWIPNSIMILLFAGAAVFAPGAHALAPAGNTEQAAVSPTPATAVTPASSATPAPTATQDKFAPIDIPGRIRENLVTDQAQLRLIAMGSAIYLYPEPTTKSVRIKLRNELVHGLNELIVLGEVTSKEGVAFYHVKSTFSRDTGYVLVRDARESRLLNAPGAGFARIEAANLELFAKPEEKAVLLFTECEHLVRILGEVNGFDYVITEGGNFGYALPSQLVRITSAELEERIALASSPAVQNTMADPMKEASAANAAKMLRAGTDSAAVRYWTTAEAHVALQGYLKKAAIAMLNVSAGAGQAPVGYEGIQFQPCLEVPMLRQGESIQRKLDFNLHGSIYSNSPITSVTAEMTPRSGEGAAIRQTVSFLPAQNVTAYSLTSKQYESLDTKFDISKLRPGLYHFTLSAASVSHPDPVSLWSVDCGIFAKKKYMLTQNKFDDNYSDAQEFFHGDSKSFLFPYYMGDGRNIGTEVVWRDANIVKSSLGRVNIHAVPNFETANHYLNSTYIRVSRLNHRTGKLDEGKTMLLDELVAKYCAYVPRFQSNLSYVSHHTLGTAVDVNDNMYPNQNIPRNHERIGGDVRNHLTYNGIKTDEAGIRYYDFTYDGTYSVRYKDVPHTIINYLLYELAFFRAGFEWGFYYETTCDAMHFMLTENDRNRHMQTDIGLRKVYEYIEPDWAYVPTPPPTPEPTPTPKATRTPEPTPTPKATPTPIPTPTPTK